MTTFNPNAATVYADGPSSDPIQPSKPQIRQLLTQYETAISAYSTGAGSTAKATRALLYADLAHAAGVTAWVYDDDNTAYNGIYIKSGASGSGSWSWILPLPYSFVIGSDTGAGTANAIQITTDIPVADGMIVAFTLYEATTSSPVTISINGGTALTLKTVRGGNASALTAGQEVWARVRTSDNTLRMISDQDVAALVAQAEAARDEAEDAAAAAALSVSAVKLRTVTSISELKAVDSSDVTQAWLESGARSGWFSIYSDDTAYTSLIAADPEEGVYVAMTDGGVAVRQGGWIFGDLRAEWFGLQTGHDTATGGINSTNAARAAANTVSIQAAINLRYHLGGGVVRISGFAYHDDFIAIPASVRIKGDGRHNILREFGDTTGGVDHQITGTLLHTYSASTARLWTDESGDGSDALVKVQIAILGENAGIEDMTIQTYGDSSAWDYGVLICGVSRGRYVNIDVRGAYAKDAHRLDVTWGRDSTNMMATAFLPAWFDADYKVLYDYGVTNNYFESCRFEGASAMAVEGGPNEALGPNGISDTVYVGCEFYNDQSSATYPTRAGVDGRLIRLNYRISGLGGAQGLSFIGCRFDAAARWVFDFNYWSNVNFVGRCFVETSGVYQTKQQGSTAWLTGTAYSIGNTVTQGGSAYRCLEAHTSGTFATDLAASKWVIITTAQQRGRIRTTLQTCSQSLDVLKFEGEFFCNLAVRQSVGGDDDSNTTPITWVPRGQSGSRIVFDTGAFKRTFDELTDGEDGTSGHILRSWATNGKITLQNMAGNAVSTWGYLAANENSWGTAYDQLWGAGTITFKRNGVTWLSQGSASLLLPLVPADTTASAANVNINTSNGNLRTSTSSIKYKTDVEPADFELSKRIILGSRPVWYRSKANGDNPNHSHWGFIAEEVAELDPRMAHWKEGETQYRRYIDVVTICPDTGSEEVCLTWPARYEDDDDTKALLVEIQDGQWVPLVTENDPFVERGIGRYVGRVEAEYVRYDIPKPNGVQYERYPVHLVAMVQHLHDTVTSMSARIQELEASGK